MDKVIDPSKCPICGEPNQCAQEISKATGKPPERCWCMTATFSPKVLDRVPEEAKKQGLHLLKMCKFVGVKYFWAAYLNALWLYFIKYKYQGRKCK